MWVKVKVLKSGAVFVAVMFWGTVFVEMMSEHRGVRRNDVF